MIIIIATIYGSALAFFNSNFTIEASEFDGNNATGGGVLYFTNGNIKIERNGFDSNSAAWGGGV